MDGSPGNLSEKESQELAERGCGIHTAGEQLGQPSHRRPLGKNVAQENWKEPLLGHRGSPLEQEPRRPLETVWGWAEGFTWGCKFSV